MGASRALWLLVVLVAGCTGAAVFSDAAAPTAAPAAAPSAAATASETIDAGPRGNEP